jgi:uracil phosphoribosyltransferase
MSGEVDLEQELRPHVAARVTGTPYEHEHRYGARVHLVSSPYLRSALARLGSPQTPLPDVLRILRTVYDVLVVMASRELPEVAVESETRMALAHPREGRYRGPALDPATQVVVVDVIRAGVIPSQTCFERLLDVLPAERVRLDHLNLARIPGPSGHVDHVDLSGSKIGGSVEGALLILPDPMGATGATTCRVIEQYLAHHGRPRKILCLPTIATPEYLRTVLGAFQELVVYAARLDRGLSAPEVLATTPGTHWDRERGLDDHDYIVPGAGGLGEVLNNSWV